MGPLEKIHAIQAQLAEAVVGQQALIERTLIALLTDGHLLVEGPPGLAKTRMVKCLSRLLDAQFNRIQFTTDLLPADLTGTDIFMQSTGEFVFQPGPLFGNLILADEINRAPAKVQSALLEAMEERQISIGNHTRKLPELFMVMATQNPLEQAGTFPLPEAQLDRFMLHVLLDYPDSAAEEKILDIYHAEMLGTPFSTLEHGEPLSFSAIKHIRREILSTFIAETLKRYMIEIVRTTRDPVQYDPDLKDLVEYGASPRGLLAISRCACARAWLMGRNYVTPEDIQNIAADTLRHRMILTFEAQSQNLNADHLIGRILDRVPCP